jgi:DNA-binding winged helix-turn-helix (wHTH) protein
MASEADENSVEAYVSFLRKKLRFLGSNLLIKTFRMLGYRLEEIGGSARLGTDEQADDDIEALVEGSANSEGSEVPGDSEDSPC